MANDLIIKIKNFVKPIYPVVSENLIKEAETTVNFELPLLLKRIYREIGNGGFGPGYGLLGFGSGKLTDEGKTIIDHYLTLCKADMEDPYWSWPNGLLPFCDWGCAIYSCISCLDHPYAIIWFDPNNHEIGKPWDSAFMMHKFSFEDWLMDWLNNEDFLSELKNK